jgi:hypothetical protein
VFAPLDFDVTDASENVAIGNWCCLPDGFAAGIGVLGHSIANPASFLVAATLTQRIIRLGAYDGGSSLAIFAAMSYSAASDICSASFPCMASCVHNFAISRNACLYSSLSVSSAQCRHCSAKDRYSFEVGMMRVSQVPHQFSVV